MFYSYSILLAVPPLQFSLLPSLDVWFWFYRKKSFVICVIHHNGQLSFTWWNSCVFEYGIEIIVATFLTSSARSVRWELRRFQIVEVTSTSSHKGELSTAAKCNLSQGGSAVRTILRARPDESTVDNGLSRFLTTPILRFQCTYLSATDTGLISCLLML